mmetsp:Transcript_140036/g.261083  ORF Transcript_140036/g.261083 Transcript_140036/m.261083 type:complete len:97 (-) Transcript_140036:648-938(-)
MVRTGAHHPLDQSQAAAGIDQFAFLVKVWILTQLLEAFAIQHALAAGALTQDVLEAGVTIHRVPSAGAAKFLTSWRGRLHWPRHREAVIGGDQDGN